MLDNISLLKNSKDFLEIHQSPFFQKHFVEEYIGNIPRLAYDLFQIRLTYQQIDVINEFMKSGGWRGGRLVVPSGHGTGKTKLLSIIAVCHLLLFEKSITRIQAPKKEQVTKFSFKEIKDNLNSLDAPFRWNDRVVKNDWHFLLKFVQMNTELIYIKGYKESWYIESATAPKGDPTNLSGQHNANYLLIFDEMSGIKDSHVDGSLGALSEKYNSCIGFSQHTRTSGRFHEFVTTRSVSHGGIWHVHRLSSEKSPRVTESAIMGWKSTYSENEYHVRVLGLPPIFEDGFLLNSNEAMMAYTKKGKEWIDTLVFDTLTFSTDVSYTGGRDSAVISKLRVSVVENALGQLKAFIIVDDILVYQGKNGKKPTEIAEETYNVFMKEIDNIPESKNFFKYCRLAIDATAGGHESYTTLDTLIQGTSLGDVIVNPIRWGSDRIVGNDKKRFFNARAKANVLLKEAIAENRFYIATNKYKTRVLNELSHIPFNFDAIFRYKMLSKQEMAKKGIRSPDIIDTLSQQFLISYAKSEDLGNEEELDDIETVADIMGDEFDELETYDNSEDIDTDEEFEDLDSILIT